MADTVNQETPRSVSIEEFNKVVEQNKATMDELNKLKKIFDERQTKTLDKEGILKVLGIEKAPEKPIAEVLDEKFKTLSCEMDSLKAQIKEKDEKLALNDKKQKIREAAKNYNFVDVNDVLTVIDYSNDDIDGQVKAIAEAKPHWIAATKNQGSSFASFQSGANDLQKQITDAVKSGNASLAIALKTQAYKQNK